MAKKKNNKTKVNDVKKKEKVVKETKNKKEKNTTVISANDTQKKSLWIRFRIFCHGVASETKRVHWASKEKLIKYSISTIVFVIFLALFFYCIDVIFAAIQALFK